MKAPLTLAALLGAVLSSATAAEAATTLTHDPQQPVLDCNKDLRVAALGPLADLKPAAGTENVIAAKGGGGGGGARTNTNTTTTKGRTPSTSTRRACW
jgi:hypothetical protein